MYSKHETAILYQRLWRGHVRIDCIACTEVKPHNKNDKHSKKYNFESNAGLQERANNHLSRYHLRTRVPQSKINKIFFC